MMVNLGAAVNVIHGIRTHHAQTTGCPTWVALTVARAQARALLTSTDPAVHLALVDALVRAGVLTERFAIRDEDGSVWLTVHRASARKSDATNLAPTAKACIDGLVDAGWLPDDDDTHITATTFVAGEPRKPPALTITITEQGDRA